VRASDDRFGDERQLGVRGLLADDARKHVPRGFAPLLCISMKQTVVRVLAVLPLWAYWR
jgi:hypothetical protein